MGTIKKLFTLAKILLLTITAGHSQWDNRFNGQGDFSDQFNRVATDDAGNSYLAGYTINPDQSKDLLLVKLDPLGDTLWANIYNGPGNGPDEAVAMTIDPAGNIYTTGYQKGVGTGYDFITIKYDASGEILWTATYNYTSNEFDQSNAIAVDGSGNVFIAGQSDKDVSLINNDDYVVIKYNSSGTQQWVKRTNGFGNSTDRPSIIAIETDGNVVVTGRSDNLSDDDYLTVKYNASNGDELWRSYFDRTHHDRPTGMVINPSNGKIYVTGRSSNGDNYDYATVCYGSDGVEQWSAIFDYVDDDRATAIALDGSGNIYVTGQSDANAALAGINYEIVTVKYNSLGAQQFAQSFGGLAGGDDVPAGMVTDDSGNVFLAGYSDQDAGAGINNDYVVLKYNSTGTLQWSTNYNNAGSSNDVPFAITKNSSGEIIVTGFSETIPDKNGVTVKLNASGDVIWSSEFNGVGDNSDNSHFIARDSHNSTYIAGYSSGYQTDRNFLVLKIGATGNVLWQQQINGTSSTQSIDDALALSFDTDENIYAAGFTKNSGTGYDMTIAKFNSDGDSIWVQNYNYDLANETDKAVAIGTDISNNIYVTGRSDSDPSFSSNDDIVTIKYSSAGLQNWVKRYNGAGNGIDQPKAMKVTAEGSVYVAGKTFNGIDYDMILIKYDAAGTELWVKKFNSMNGDDECVAITLDSDENIFLTGYVTNSSGNDKDIAVLKYLSNGTLLWNVSYDGPENGNDEANGIVIDGNNNVIICGTVDADTSSLTLNSDMCTIQYNGDGEFQWINIYDGGGNDDASEISVDGTNHIYITGQSDRGTGGVLNYDFVTIQYQQDGTQSEIQTYNGTGNASDVPNTMMVKENGYYVTGGSYGINSQRDIETILYGTTPDAVSEVNPEHPFLNFYPNPMHSVSVIDLSSLQDMGFNEANYYITDVTGRTLRTWSSAYQPLLTLNRETLPAGIYVIHISFDNTTDYPIKFTVY